MTWYELIERLGFPTVVIVFIGVCLYKSGRWIAEVSMGEDGIIRRLIQRAIDYIEVAQDHSSQAILLHQQAIRLHQDHANAQARFVELLEGIQIERHDPNRDCSVIRLQRAAIHACDMIDAVAPRLGVETIRFTNSIRRELHPSAETPCQIQHAKQDGRP